MDRQELFSDLISKCGDAAYNFALRLSGNESDAQDLVQQSFLKAFENIKSFDPSKPFQPWLNTILHNLYVDQVKRYERSHVVSLDAPSPVEDGCWSDLLPDSILTPLEQMTQAEIESTVQGALGKLDLGFRTPIILSDIEHLSYEEIAKIMDCPVGTVRSRIHRGRRILRKKLAAYFESGEMKRTKQ